MDLVSIIIPTYKRSNLLERALLSLVNQTYTNIEIIIVDDNVEYLEERINTKKIIDKYKNDKRIIYVENRENLGGSLSRNEGIKISTGKYVSFLDDDDEYELEKIEKQYLFYKKRFRYDEGIIYSQSKIFDKYGEKINSTKTYIKGNKESLLYMMTGNLATTGNLFLPKILIEEVNGFKKMDCGQEWWLIFNILLKGYECEYMRDELLKYYEHNTERTTTNYLKKYNGEKKINQIKKQYLYLYSEKEQKIINYRNNILLANYAIKINLLEVKKNLLEAKKYNRLKIEDILKISIKYFFNEKKYNLLKKILK